MRHTCLDKLRAQADDLSVEFEIRPARAADAEGFVRTHERAWDAAMGEILGKPLVELMPFEGRLERFRTSFVRLRDDAGAFVAEADGEIVGLVVFAAGEVRDLYVVPEAWGSGVAPTLLTAALDALRGRGAQEALLWVVEQNTRARRFYEREGWNADGESRQTPFGPVEIRYTRQLSDNVAESGN